ncbi:MAG TPA: metallophosphoesterase [Flavisolibacter sp.]|nr:metallophosphoesterase [Flavisolibacter sp.]
MLNKILCLFFSVSIVFIANSQYSALPDTTSENNEIAFISDTQAPMWVETLLLKKKNNKYATKQIFNNLSARKPSSVFILGDVVNLGYSTRQWKPMDKYLELLRSQNIAVHAVLGNHEVMGRSKVGLKKFQERFPNHVPTGFVEVKDSIAIVLLNSNFGKMTRQEDEAQVTWYRKTLKELDADPAIRFIVSACHHSPYTNSKIVGPSTSVQQKFVAPFLQSAKSNLFLSGHCHGFEQYQVKGKNFFVIGGGGGLTQPLKKGDNTLPDLASDYKPIFHYLTIKRSDDELHLTSYQINKDFSDFEEGKKFTIKAIGTTTELKDVVEVRSTQ